MPVPRARAPQTATELKPAEGPPALGSGHWAFCSVMADTFITSSEKLSFQKSPSTQLQVLFLEKIFS